MATKGKGKGSGRRGTNNSNKLTPTMSMLSPPKYGGSSPSHSYAEMATYRISQSDDTTIGHLQKHVQTSIAEFQKNIQSTLDQLFKQMKQLEIDLNKSIEFQSARIDELAGKIEPLQNVITDQQTEINKLNDAVKYHSEMLNKQERMSRRNNLRIVGVTATEGENCLDIAEDILAQKFNMADATVERAHRDGRGKDGRSPHILVKLLSYRDKMDVLRQSRSTLKDTNFFIVDDLTKIDLAEKRKYSQQVKGLYNKGTKLRFVAGKWRLNGQPYSFGHSD